MKITRLSTAVLEANFDWVLVKIETDAGITGYGEGFMAPALTAVIREFGAILAMLAVPATLAAIAILVAQRTHADEAHAQTTAAH